MIDIARIKSLLEQVPQPPGEPLPNGISDVECDDLEARMGIPLPLEFRKWLNMSNGPCVGPGGFYGIRTQRPHLDIETHFVRHPSWKVRKWVPIAGDGCGNYYVLSTSYEFGRGKPVLFVDTHVSSEEPAFIVASDIEHFLVFILERELGKKDWPFGAESVIRSDPRILEFTGVNLPWVQP